MLVGMKRPSLLSTLCPLLLAACSQNASSGDEKPLNRRFHTPERVEKKLELMEQRWDHHPGVQRRMERDEKLAELRRGPEKAKPAR